MIMCLKIKKAKGFTLVELILTALVAVIVMAGAGLVLVDSQRGWNKMYNRVHGDVTTEAYVARRAFDKVVRKSSVSRSLVDADGQFVEVYYFEDFNSTKPDRFANFYREGSLLMVDYGKYDWDTKTTTTESTVTLSHNVKAVNFFVQGLSVQMLLTLDDERESVTMVSSAVRHN